MNSWFMQETLLHLTMFPGCDTTNVARKNKMNSGCIVHRMRINVKEPRMVLRSLFVWWKLPWSAYCNEEALAGYEPAQALSSRNTINW
jgi:hypothetical protein